MSSRQVYASIFVRQCRFIGSTTNVVAKEHLRMPAYKPKFVEEDKNGLWERKGSFRPQDDASKPVFSMVLPPPNITGKLHLGHALGCTIQDVIVRRMRMLGHNVLWLPGMDHAGIATQGVVEKNLKNTQNLDRHQLGRERFNMEIWQWKEAHSRSIKDQLKALGCSLDWSREIFTMSPAHSNAVNLAFVKLFQKGLIYRKNALINWCKALNSTVSDIEVNNVTIEGDTDLDVQGYVKPVKFGVLYKFAYKVYGSDEEVVVATTMPETMLGDTAIAVHPDDERYKHLKDKVCLHPFRNDTIPIIFDTFVDMKFGTGAVKITPAHSKIDYEVAEKHKLPLLQVINEEGLIENCPYFNKMKRYDCRDYIIRKLDEFSLMRGKSDHKVNLPVCSRTGDIIDYLPKEQWFLSCSEMNQKVMNLTNEGKIKFNPEKYEKNWADWIGSNKDWCISRQLWWGHQIPAYKCSNETEHVWIAAMNEAMARKLAMTVLRRMPDEIEVEQDTDVLDTWFSSGIYPFAALGWPAEAKKDYQKYYPLSLMATGHDILGFWVHRMAILGNELTGKLPFSNVLLHGVICDTEGAKMSKSKGNVIDPMDIIQGISLEDLKEKTEQLQRNGTLSKDECKKALKYHKKHFPNGIPECGTDALRFTLLSQDIKSHYVNFDLHQCNANKLFCNKIWQSVQYVNRCYDRLRSKQYKLESEKNLDIGEINLDCLSFFDKWILSRLSHMVELVNKNMDDYNFHLATKSIRNLLYGEFCDVYLETTKPAFDDEENWRPAFAHAHTLSTVLDTSLRCLSPFMVYLTEELIPRVPNFEENIIWNYEDDSQLYYDFPETEEFQNWRDVELEKRANKVIETVNLVREMKGLYAIPHKVKPNIIVRTSDDHLTEDIMETRTPFVHLTRCTDLVITSNEVATKNYVKAFLDQSTEVHIELQGNIDNSVATAKNRLKKKIEKLENILQKMEQKFSTDGKSESVPEWNRIIDKEKILLKKIELQQLKSLTE